MRRGPVRERIPPGKAVARGRIPGQGPKMVVLVLIVAAGVLGAAVLLVACVALGARTEAPGPPMMETHASQKPMEEPQTGPGNGDPPGPSAAATGRAA